MQQYHKHILRVVLTVKFHYFRKYSYYNKRKSLNIRNITQNISVMR
jgi:hypothetical protein